MKMLRHTQFLVASLAVLAFSVEGQRFRGSFRSNCPQLHPQVFKGYIPRGNLTSGNIQAQCIITNNNRYHMLLITGNFSRVDDIHTVDHCVLSCCTNDHCNIALMNDEKCYHVACVSSDLCMPIQSPLSDASLHVSLVLVKPVSNEETWWDLLNNADDGNDDPTDREVISRLINEGHRRFDDSYINDMMMDETSYDFKNPVHECEVGLSVQCNVNEDCVRVLPKSRSGVCQCKEGYIRNTAGICRPQIAKDDFQSPSVSDKVTQISNSINKETSSASTPKQLTVSVVSKEVRYFTINI